MSERIHATGVAREGRGVLIAGPSGSGKSDLALRMIDRGWTLIADDQTQLTLRDGHLTASPPDTIAGQMEVRGLGIVTMDYSASAPVSLLVRLGEPVDRLPPAGLSERIAGIDLPLIRVDARSPSAPLVVELAMDRLERA